MTDSLASKLEIHILTNFTSQLLVAGIQQKLHNDGLIAEVIASNFDQIIQHLSSMPNKSSASRHIFILTRAENLDEEFAVKNSLPARSALQSRYLEFLEAVELQIEQIEGQFYLSSLFEVSESLAFDANDFQQVELKRDLTLRKSVIYLALIVTSLTIISVIIATIYAYLIGSLLNTFLLKSLVVFLVSGFLFAYYYYSLDRNYKSSTRVPMILSILASLVILLTIVCSIYIFGSPSKVRDLNIDSAKVNDLTSISFSITNFYSQNNKLPENLNQLGNNLKDKETGLDYGYIVLSASSSKYFLCATFKTDVDYKNDYNLSDWSHTKGDYCFELDATKKQY